MTPLFRKFLGLNWVIVITMLGLLVFGVFAIYSASWMRDEQALSEVYRKQIILIILGFAVFFITSIIDYRWIKWGAIPMYIVGLVGLFLVRIPGIGEIRGGAQSWIPIPGGLTIQPSQLAIVGGMLLLAWLLSVHEGMPRFFRHPLTRLFLVAIFAGVPIALVLTESDLGSAFVWFPVVACMLLVGRIPFRYLIVIFLIGNAALPTIYYFKLKDYQKERIETFVGMLTNSKNIDPQGAAWVPRHLRIAVGSAGWEGKGFKGHKIKAIKPDAKTVNEMGFIPEHPAINDFIFSVIAEEHGFRGAMILITALALLLLQCLFVGFYSRDQMGRLLVAAIVGQLFAHIFMNVGMNILLVPITGLPLPLISYGGTFLMINMFCLGLIQSVWVHRNVPAVQKNQAGYQ